VDVRISVESSVLNWIRSYKKFVKRIEEYLENFTPSVFKIFFTSVPSSVPNFTPIGATTRVQDYRTPKTENFTQI